MARAMVSHWPIITSSTHPFSSTPSPSPRYYSTPLSSHFRCKISQKNSVASCSGNAAAVADRVLVDIKISGIIACLRAKSAEDAVEAARAALRGGISVLEITMSTPGVFEALQVLVREYPSVSIGVGTVLDRADAKNALKIGAKFLMSPAMVKGILDDVSEGQALYIPGATTPTEILYAFNDGAKIVKVVQKSVLVFIILSKKKVESIIKDFKPLGKRGRDDRVQWVSELMEENGRKWNKSLILSIFSAKESEEILKLSIDDQGKKDKLVWCLNKDGNFSVKSCYKALIDQKVQSKGLPESSNGAKEMKKLCDMIWKLKIKPKLKIFLWRCVHDSLPVATNLHKKGIILDPCCTLCGDRPETLMHLFFECERAHKIWKLAAVRWDSSMLNTDQFKIWWGNICNAKKGDCWEDRIELTVYMLWWLWKTRNCWVFENKKIMEKDIPDKAKEDWLEYKEICGKPLMSAGLISKNCMNVGQRNIFVSACVIPLGGSGFGGIAMDETGSICRNWGVLLHQNCDHSESLLLGVKHALWRAFLLDWNSISIKVDDKEMAQALQKERPLEGSYRILFEDICALKFLFSSVSFHFVAQDDWIDQCACLALNAVVVSSSHDRLDVCPAWS